MGYTEIVKGKTTVRHLNSFFLFLWLFLTSCNGYFPEFFHGQLFEEDTQIEQKKQEEADLQLKITKLVLLLQDKGVQTRVIAAQKLGELKYRAISAISALHETLFDPHPKVKVAALFALTQLGPKAIPALIKITRADVEQLTKSPQELFETEIKKWAFDKLKKTKNYKKPDINLQEVDQFIISVAKKRKKYALASECMFLVLREQAVDGTSELLTYLKTTTNEIEKFIIYYLLRLTPLKEMSETALPVILSTLKTTTRQSPQSILSHTLSTFLEHTRSRFSRKLNDKQNQFVAKDIEYRIEIASQTLPALTLSLITSLNPTIENNHIQSLLQIVFLLEDLDAFFNSGLIYPISVEKRNLFKATYAKLSKATYPTLVNYLEHVDHQNFTEFLSLFHSTLSGKENRHLIIPALMSQLKGYDTQRFPFIGYCLQSLGVDITTYMPSATELDVLEPEARQALLWALCRLDDPKTLAYITPFLKYPEHNWQILKYLKKKTHKLDKPAVAQLAKLVDGSNSQNSKSAKEILIKQGIGILEDLNILKHKRGYHQRPLIEVMMQIAKAHRKSTKIK